MPAQPFSINTEMLGLWLSPRLGSTKLLAMVGHSSRDLDTPPGLNATSRRPERRKVGVFVYMSTSVGARPS